MAVAIVEMEHALLGEALDVYRYYVENSTATFQISRPTKADMEKLLFFPQEKTEQYRSFALLEDSVFAGYGLVTRFKSREAYDTTAEVTVYLHPRATGKGYGALMLAHLETFARERGMHSLVAQISAENEASCKLFARAGYSLCARYHEVGRKFDRWLDLVCYEKQLD